MGAKFIYFFFKMGMKRNSPHLFYVGRGLKFDARRMIEYGGEIHLFFFQNGNEAEFPPSFLRRQAGLRP